MWTDEVLVSDSGLSYRRMGSGRPLVLLHGIPGSAATWAQVVERLPADIEVIVPDLLGFGRSARPRGLYALHAVAQADALAALLDELQLTRAVVVGHDFGGPISLMLYAARPDLVAAVGLFATNAFTDTPIPFPLSTVTWPIVGALARQALFSGPSLRMMLRQGVGSGGPQLDPSIHLGDAAQQASIATIFTESLVDLVQLYEPVEAQLHALRVPAIVGWGDKDMFFSLAQGKRTADAAGAEFRCYPEAGHFLPQERPVELAADISALIVTAA
ncbi:MAG: alpha/beta hydrolase [Mycobacteriaceae bacterium]|nr:alpha/beta hydrolase [Mycobacteriaceae bacterium]